MWGAYAQPLALMDVALAWARTLAQTRGMNVVHFSMDGDKECEC